MEKNLFYEEQKFRQGWLTILFLVSVGSVIWPFAYGIYSQEVLNIPYGDNPVSSSALLIIGLIVALVISAIFIMLFKAKLKTKVTDEAIWVSFPPLIRKWKKITPEMIEKYEVRKFNPRREFGGHGVKRKIRKGTAYSVSGNIGLQLYFKNGKKLLIGTQRKQALEYALKKLMNVESEGLE
jgi:hypothetical protein